ncbi:hypothetical protein RUM44_002352 [Polyplax serrata]|uniref:Methenyltetrahydrofolate synthase domain-containing protein n=1 Tax=Polyplax serrata TaxID=468196 RepID=A0ABR1AML6_POLSC
MSTTEQSNGETNCVRTEDSSPTQTSAGTKEETSKYYFRKQVWTHFEKNGLVSFPRPVRGRIPNFHGAPKAAEKLAELDVFKNANFIKVNSDKPQENVRILTLEKKKNLLVSAPRDKEAVFMTVVPPSFGNADLKKAASRRGMLELGKPIELGSDIKVDLVVVGSVAVSRQGHRIGKGEGFGDLEFAILLESGAITKDTIVATTVHDSQVFDCLPQGLFKEYDVSVDIIVTPSEVIHVTSKLAKPTGIVWNLLSQRKMNLMAVLKILKEKEIVYVFESKNMWWRTPTYCRMVEKWEVGIERHRKAKKLSKCLYQMSIDIMYQHWNGRELCLKEDTDSETERTTRRLYQARHFVSYTKKRPVTKTESDKQATVPSGQVDIHKEKKKQSRRLNRFVKRPVDVNNVNTESDLRKQKKLYHRRRRFPRFPIQFSIRIGNIDSNVRVRDLKNALAERNVKPTVITWRGHKGFAFIHFAKPKKEPESPNQVENIIASLQDMKIGNGDDGVTLLVEHTKPIFRIETTGVTTI